MSALERLIDTHVHLDQYPPEDVPGLLDRAGKVGIDRVLAIGVSVPSSRAAVALARRHPAVRAAVGIHPRWLGEAADTAVAVRELERLAREETVVAIGEVGLDLGGGIPVAAQREFLEAMLDLARRVDRAVVLHVVGAHDEALATLDAAGDRIRAVVHYFVGDVGLAERYLAAGCLLSVGKPVARPENFALRSAIAAMPIDRLVIETDSYPLPGRTTEPRDLPLVCQAIAAIRRTDAAEIAAITTANAGRLFRLT